jgi:acyl-CoA dehydrogenase
MQRALDLSIDWSKNRVTFGKPLAARQAIQWQIVDMFIDHQALQALTYQMAARADAGEDIRAEAGMVKLTSMIWGTRTLDQAIQIHGAMGESLEMPLTLFYRYLRHGQIGGGANEIQRMQIARKLLRD